MIDFDGVEQRIESEMHRCLDVATSSDVGSPLHKEAIDRTIELYKATSEKVSNDEKRENERIKNEVAGQLEEAKLKFEKQKHTDEVKFDWWKMGFDTWLTTTKIITGFALGSAAFNADNNYKLFNKWIVQHAGKLMG